MSSFLKGKKIDIILIVLLSWKILGFRKKTKSLFRNSNWNTGDFTKKTNFYKKNYNMIFFCRPRFEVFKKISRLVEKANKVGKSSPTKVQDKLKGFQTVCDISKTVGSSLPPTPLSPKRVESPVTPELGRGKRSKITPNCKIAACSSHSTMPHVHNFVPPALDIDLRLRIMMIKMRIGLTSLINFGSQNLRKRRPRLSGQCFPTPWRLPNVVMLERLKLPCG